MNSIPIKLLLADDDKDDCHLFQEALEEIPLHTTLATVHNGEQLMLLLSLKTGQLPDILFLDLNMPRKNGSECLVEIMLNEDLKKLPVIIYSTSFDHNMVNLLRKKGARHYIRKPAEFSELKKVIHEAINFVVQPDLSRDRKNSFIIRVK